MSSINLKEIVNSSWMHVTIGFLISLNLITLGLETTLDQHSIFEKGINIVNHVILFAFVVEILLKILAERAEFFKDPWHVFDFIVVAVSLVSFNSVYQLFRFVRIIWLLRLITVFPQFQHLIDAIIRAIPHMLSVAFMLILSVYVFAVIGTISFGTVLPHTYGDLVTSMGTLLQTMLMEHTWSERLEELEKHFPLAWTYIIPQIILLNYLLLHLVIGIIVSALHRQHEEEQEKKKETIYTLFKEGSECEKHPLSYETQTLLSELSHIKKLLLKK